jgi:PAS domain-containing protein
MNIETLTLRTHAALGRLAELERRAERAAAQGALFRPALRELSAALEELRVANEHLQEQNRSLGETRSEATRGQRLLEEIQNAMPLACLLTDNGPTIHYANPQAAAFLNVSRERLTGKPLMLFVMDRQALFDTVARLREADAEALEMNVVVRPRERHPRHAQITVRRLEHADRWCWFLREDGGIVTPH